MREDIWHILLILAWNFMICVNELSDLKCNKREILEPLAVLITLYTTLQRAVETTRSFWFELV